MDDSVTEDVLSATFPDSPPPYSVRPARDRFTRFMRLARFGYPSLLRVSRRRASYAVGRETDLLVDGFMRSANTFTTVQVAVLNPSLNIAHHAHAVSQFTAAHRLDVPALLLVREPVDAVASIRAGWPHWSAGASASDDLNYWTRFHERILRWAPTADAVRTSHLQEDLRRIESDPRFAAIELTSPMLTSASVDEMVRRVESERGDRGTIDRSSAGDIRSDRRASAAERLREEVDPDEIARAEACYARVIERLGQ